METKDSHQEEMSDTGKLVPLRWLRTKFEMTTQF